jgi:putative acyl-CoA dehydrogenase
VTVLAPTHEVLNQAPPLQGHNAFHADPALREALVREDASWAVERAAEAGALVASAEAQEHSRRAQRNIPKLHTHDRQGNRIDAIEYDPSMHWMLRQGIEREVHSLPWRDPRPGAHVARAALMYLFNELDTGPTCPFSINYGSVATLRHDPALAAEWEPLVTLPDYDRYAQVGMVMTEKQGGSDLRANTTRAEPAGGGWYELTGHKWFCTHPVFRIFLTLAHTPGGIACFVAERPHPGFRLQRLKDKLGGRCLASAEVEYDRLPARILGQEGRGVAVMATQINYTRLDTLLGVAGMIRRSVAEAIWHARHRMAFGQRLADQPAMKSVLADLALESEASMTATMRVARAYDSDGELPFRRLGTAVMKYYVCKRSAATTAEALECLGGNGFVEDFAPAQFYRDSEIGTVWEGSGNVAALDVLRAIQREPETLDAFMTECELATGGHPLLDAHLAQLRAADPRGAPAAANGAPTESAAFADPWHARRTVEALALALEASLLVRHAPHAVGDAFCSSRLGDRGLAFGTMPHVEADTIIERSLEV